MVELSFPPQQLKPTHKLIEDRTAERHLTDYEGKEFLVKISAGDDGFGLDRSTDSRSLGRKGEPGSLWIYDEFRFISGITKHPKLIQIVHQFGKLSAEKISNKRIYFYARLLGGPEPAWKILVQTD